jgi:hypothetical protein
VRVDEGFSTVLHLADKVVERYPTRYPGGGCRAIVLDSQRLTVQERVT